MRLLEELTDDIEVERTRSGNVIIRQGGSGRRSRVVLYDYEAHALAAWIKKNVPKEA